MTTVKVIHSPDYHTNERRFPSHDNEMPCLICGRAIKMTDDTKMVHLVNGGGEALATVDEASYHDDGGDLGFYPIGSDCLKRHPELNACVA